MHPSGYLFFILTGIVAALAVVLAYALAKIAAVGRGLPDGRVSREQGTLVAGVTDALQDMRQQERAMKARAEASERMSDQIVSSLTSGLLVVHPSGSVLTLNPAGRRLLGLPDAEDHAPRFEAVLVHAPALAELIRECLARGTPMARRTIETVGTSSATHLGVTVSPMPGQGTKENGAICLFTDLSTIVDLEEQLRLKDSLARLGELTAGIAHEFRNGLATIHGYGRLVDPARLPPDYRPYIAGIRSETEALGQVVTNFLNFAKPAKLVLTPVDMTALVHRAADDMRPEIAGRGGSISVQGLFTEVDGDDVLLRQAVNNLCRNALEAAVDGGAVPHVAIRGEVDGDGGLLRVTVSDNGPGITPAVAERMFRPFFTTKAKGIGLGLALVQKIIVTHNGRVAAVPEATHGGHVSFTLPLPRARDRPR